MTSFETFLWKDGISEGLLPDCARYERSSGFPLTTRAGYGPGRESKAMYFSSRSVFFCSTYFVKVMSCCKCRIDGRDLVEVLFANSGVHSVCIG